MSNSKPFFVGSDNHQQQREMFRSAHEQPPVRALTASWKYVDDIASITFQVLRLRRCVTGIIDPGQVFPE